MFLYLGGMAWPQSLITSCPPLQTSKAQVCTPCSHASWLQVPNVPNLAAIQGPVYLKYNSHTHGEQSPYV